MCVVLEVSRSGYYDWKDRPPGKRELETQQILKIAKKSHAECRGMCGLDKILADVREVFPRCSRQRLYGIQKENQLYSIRKRKFKATTNSNHKLPVAENLLNQDFKIDKPAAVWVTDISYIDTLEGWLYLATVKDICTKEIVGWATDCSGIDCTRSFILFFAEGLGTPVPLFPPQRLVIGGLYRYVRNPMYVALLAVIIDQGMLFSQLSLLLYAAVLWLVIAGWIRWYEEPALTHQFGTYFEAYRRAMPAWWPRLTPWQPSERP